MDLKAAWSVSQVQPKQSDILRSCIPSLHLKETETLFQRHSFYQKGTFLS